MKTSPCSSRKCRGVLLLVVLSMLTLFLLLGTAYMVASTRARVSARAFNRLAMQSDEARIPVATYLDAALLRVMRGGAPYPSFAPAVVGGPPYSGNPAFESILEDKYGQDTSLTGTATSVVFSSGTTSLGPVLYVSGSTLSPIIAGTSTTGTTAGELPGRVITLCPQDGEPTSHRILSAALTSTTFSLIVDTPSRPDSFPIPKPPTRVIVNGREFDAQGKTNEAWDAFDVDNPFLARVEPSPSLVSSSQVKRASFLTVAQTASFPSDAADNDNDGVKDGVFLDFGFPGIPTATGTIDLHASVLVVDLDSRFNVNAHGNLATRMYLSGTFPAVSGTSLTNIPMGSGYGPPEVQALWMFAPTGTSTTVRLLAGGTAVSGTRPAGSRFSTSGSTPSLQPLQGRYGELIGSPATDLAAAIPSSPGVSGDALPGKAGDDDLVSQITDQRSPPSYDKNSKQWTVSGTGASGLPSGWWSGTAGQNWSALRGSYNSPPDLHGRMKTVTVKTNASITPRLGFSKIEWSGEAKDDPYELQLGPLATKNGWLADPNTSGVRPVYDNVYTVTELEAVLRPYDTDSFQLPLRLSATLGPLVEAARLKVTTTSWDTTAITGSAAANIARWIRTSGSSFQPSKSPTSGSLGGEVARGERFDLNRPLTSDKPATYDPGALYYVQRQAYAKDLYTLLCALLHPSAPPSPSKAKEYAQWAVNVVDFRDGDSTITPFDYDHNILDGWDADGDANTPDSSGVVWGVERPEILIMQTSAWENDSTGELFVTLYRPWNAEAVSTSGTLAAEPVDTALEAVGVPKNEVDLGRKSAGGQPIWRIRVDDGNGNRAFIRLDDVPATPPAGVFGSSAITGTNTPRLKVDSWLCIHGSGTQGAGIPAGLNAVKIDVGGAFRVPGNLPTTPLPPESWKRSMVYLERLTDPSAADADDSTWDLPPGTPAAPHYRVVDEAPVEVVNRVSMPPLPLPPYSEIRRGIGDPKSALWRTVPITTTGTSPVALSSFPPTSSKARWFHWPNRPFVSAAELCLVQSGSAIEVLRTYEAPEKSKNALRAIHSGTNQLLLLDAVHVPSRFSGLHRTVTHDPNDDLRFAGIFKETTPVNQLSSYREPGRVNLNTITSDDVWNAVVAGPLAKPGSPDEPMPPKVRTTGTSGGSPPPVVADFVTNPVKTMSGLITFDAAPALDYFEDTHQKLVESGTHNPANLIFTGNRLANTATIRSNVFAIWITLRQSIQNDPDSVRYHRAFYIVDRSIPVAHEPGKDNNVWDAVVLRRIIQ
jgi:hypothetical protein